jgi:SulP family sulfate permease
VLIAGMKHQPKDVLKRTGLYPLIGENHFFEHTGEAIDYALTQLDTNQCIGSKHYVFRECGLLSNPEKAQ